MDGSDSEIPDDILANIFQLLKGNELKICRQVSQYWRQISSPVLNEKTCILFNGERKEQKNIFLVVFTYFSKNTNRCKEMFTYLDKSETKFSLWEYLRLRKMSSTQVNICLQNWALENSMSNQCFETVKTLDLVHCSIDCMIFMELLTLFKNLQTFIDTWSTFYSTSWFDGICRRVDKLEAAMQQKYGSSSRSKGLGHPFQKISIQQVDIDANLRILLKMFDITCNQLEEFTITLDSPKNSVDPSWRSDFCNLLGIFLVKHSFTLKKLSVHWYNVGYPDSVPDFLKVLRIFTTMTINVENNVLEELNMDFLFVFLSSPEITNILVPCLSKLKKLKIFTIQKVVCVGLRSLDVLEQLKPPGATYNLEFGAVICDLPFMEFPSIEEHQAVLKSEFFRMNLVSLFIQVRTNLPTLTSLLPLSAETPKYYKKLKEIAILCRDFDGLRQETPPVFSEFNINLIVKTFPNLTRLRIIDGDPFSYKDPAAHGQWSAMSPANIGDMDIQNIISELKYLKVILIRARLSLLTDSGLTGLSAEVCKRMNSEKTYEICDPAEEFVGLRLSNLRYLNEFSLSGLTGITDVTVHIAFNGCKTLKVLNLFGSFYQISNSGKEYLEKLASANGITIKTNI